MSKFRHVSIVASLVVIATVLLRIAFGFMFQLPWPATSEELGKDLLYFLGFGWPETANAQAQQIDAMFNGHYWMISFLFALIMVIMLYAVVVFRRQPGDETDGPHMHGNTLLEVSWTIIPTIVVIGFGVWGAFIMNDITAPKEDEMVIHVIGRQWSWSFEYPEQEGILSAELVLPVDQPVLLEMESEDVLHSFWVPEFRVKQDLVPDRTTELRITPTEVGDYKLRCAEICGLEHANMLANVRVVSETEFVAWVEEALDVPAYAELTPEERGEIWYSNGEGFGCEACHSLDGSPGAGPTWLGLYLREEEMADGSVIIADEEYIINSILNPNDQIVAGYNANVMPGNYGEQFAEREAEILQAQGVEIDIIDDLIAFIRTLEE